MVYEKLFYLMAENQASDLYITAGTPIHIKINGKTEPINQQIMDVEMIRRLLMEMITPEQFRQFEQEREMNISRGLRHLGNFRINAFWQRSSIGIVIRFIQSNIPTLESLSLPPLLSNLVMEKSGLVLVVGSTGSGKSTTLASMINHRNLERSGHIITVEDPIEYLFRHGQSIVNQREVGVDTNSWQDALRNAMRQAPDCILIGEIRDRETMQSAIAYAQTGHLCLSTLHANNAYHALNRVINFFPLENRALLFLDLSVSLKCILSQRLVCRPDGSLVPTMEILLNTRHIADLIEQGMVTEIKEAMEKSLAPGSQTFEQDLYRLYHDDIITLEEALSNADSPTNLSWLINNAKLGNKLNNDPTPAAFTAATPHSEATDVSGASFKEFSISLDDDT